METYDHHGLAIRYERRGQGDPVVFLHNGGTSHAIWSDVVARLEGDYETFALDLLGYGASDKPADGHDLDHHVEILAGFLSRLGLHDVTLVGNCMGSAISLAFAAQRPADVRALVLVNPLTSATFRAGGIGFLLGLRRRAPAVAQALYVPFRRLRLNRGLARISLRLQFGEIGRGRALHHREDLCACFTGPGQLPSLIGALDDLANYAFLDEFTPAADFPPRCTIWGVENFVLSSKAGRQLNQRLQPEREEWIAGAGHLAMLEDPETVATVIRDFLTRHPARKDEQ